MIRMILITHLHCSIFYLISHLLPLSISSSGASTQANSAQVTFDNCHGHEVDISRETEYSCRFPNIQQLVHIFFWSGRAAVLLTFN